MSHAERLVYLTNLPALEAAARAGNPEQLKAAFWSQVTVKAEKPAQSLESTADLSKPFERVQS